MKLRVEVAWESDEGEEQRSSTMMAIDRPQLAMETLGLNLGESKAMLEGVQDTVAAQQVAEDLERRRRCPNCGERYRRQRRWHEGSKDAVRDGGGRQPALESLSLPTKRSQNIPIHGVLVARSDEPGTSVPGDQMGVANPIEKVADRKCCRWIPGPTTRRFGRHLHETAERMENELGDERQLKLFAEESPSRPTMKSRRRSALATCRPMTRNRGGGGGCGS